MTTIQRIRASLSSPEKRPAQAVRAYTLSIATFLVAVMLLKTSIDMARQTKPVEGAMERFRIWRLMFHDPRAGSLVSLDALRPISQYNGLMKGKRCRGILLCIVSTCST
jgi:hypothetical protein